jgi:AmmeMemoRadiSam system protein B
MKGKKHMGDKVFPCNGAGRWFPASEHELKNTVDDFLASAKSESKNPLAVVSPHAGYVYSGMGEGYSYKVFKGKDIKRVIILGPSHYTHFHGVSVLTGFDYYNTPLGNAKIDVQTSNKLVQEKYFTYERGAHSPEHSVENQIPFIQRVLPQAGIVTCTVGHLNKGEFKQAGQSIKKYMDAKTIIAVSSDFTHYGHSFGYVPFSKDIRKNLEKLDGGAIKEIAQVDFEGFYDYVEESGATICGKHAIGVMLCAVSGTAKGRLLKYYTSSDDSGD